MKKHDASTSIGLLMWIILVAFFVWLFFFYQPNKENVNIPVECTVHSTITGYIQAQKNELETTKTTPTVYLSVGDKKPVRTSKKRLEKAIRWSCPVCGAPAEPNSLCDHCAEPYTRLYGYGFVRCWKTVDGIEWELETAPECGCTPDEVCDFCRDKLNHGWKSSGEVKYYEYSDFLKEKGLPLTEAVYPDKPVKKCKKQAAKKMEETVITREVQEAKNVQDENGQNIQQPDSSTAEAGGEAGELENGSDCSGDIDGCGTSDNVDDVKF